MKHSNQKLGFVLKFTRQALLFTTVAVFLSAAINAQTTLFQFDAQLPKEFTPATGDFEMEFILYDAPVGGNQIGASNLINDVYVHVRSLSVWLDFGAAAFNGDDRFIEIKYRHRGQGQFKKVDGRWRIVSVPYAIRALNAATADNINGVDLSDFVLTTDPRLSDARDPLPGSTYYIQNSSSLQTSANFNIDGMGTANVFSAGTQYNIGGQRVLSNAGSSNLFAGVGAGASNTTGSSNSFFGAFAGNATSTGGANAFFGAGAGTFNFSGGGNSYFGSGSGSTAQGSNNSFFGSATGGSGNGSFNSFFGSFAGRGNTTGSQNVFAGYRTGETNTVGVNNTVIGSRADVGASNLEFATAIGSFAAVNANDTIVIGKTAGIYDGVSRPADAVSIPGNLSVGGTFNANALNISGTFSANIVNATTQFNINGARMLSRPGTDNLFAGTFAGNGNTNGAGNSFFGHLAGSGNSTGSDNSFFGRRAGSVSTGSGNSFFGSYAGANGAGSGNNNTFIGRNADFTITQSEGYNNTLLGADAKINVITNGTVLRFATAIGAGARVSFSDMVVIGKEAGVYDGVSRPADIVRTAGIFQPALASPGGSPVCFNNGISLCSSSLRYKTDIQPFTGGLDLVKRLNPITFKWRDDNRPDVGFGAEDVLKIEPLLTFKNQNGEIEGVHYAQISTILVNSVKEQQKQIEAQQEQNRELREQILNQQKQIEELKKIICAVKSDAAVCQK